AAGLLADDRQQGAGDVDLVPVPDALAHGAGGDAPRQPESPRTETATDPERPEAVEEEAREVREEEAVAPEAAPASRPGAAPGMAAESAEPLVDQRIPVLTLGVGLALMGLGIGFLGLRMRRR
ncbi:hypothetical protein, partial [Streptomyces sp. NPDC001919]